MNLREILKLLLFYLLIIVPFGLIIFNLERLGASSYLILIFAYVLLYRPILHIIRLWDLKLVGKENWMRLFIPFWYLRFFRQLYFSVGT